MFQKSVLLHDLLGYPFGVTELTHPGKLAAGQPFKLEAKIRNDGVAPFYYPWPVYITLIDGTEHDVIRLNATEADPQCDPHLWTPGEHNLTAMIQLPETIPPGIYTIALSVDDPVTGQPGLRLANEGRRDAKGRYRLSHLQIGN